MPLMKVGMELKSVPSRWHERLCPTQEKHELPAADGLFLKYFLQASIGREGR